MKARDPVFLVVAYHRPAQLSRLCGVLREGFPAARILVHIDRKVALQPFVEGCRAANVEFVERRHPVWWGGYSLLEVILELSRSALAEPFSHAVLLTGQCYPIRPLDQLRETLASHTDRDFVDIRHLRTEWPEVLSRYEEYWYTDRWSRWPRFAALLRKVSNRLVGPRAFPGGDLYGGSGWWTLSHESLRLVVHAFDRRWKRFFRRGLIPDECAVQSLLAAVGRTEVALPPLTYVRFDAARSRNHPITWASSDLPELAASGRHFARKFDTEQDPDVLDLIDRELLRRSTA